LHEKKNIDTIFLVRLKARHTLRCNGVLYIVVGDHLVISESCLECLPCHLSLSYVLAVDGLCYYILLRKTSYKTVLSQQMFFSWKWFWRRYSVEYFFLKEQGLAVASVIKNLLEILHSKHVKRRKIDF